MICDKALMINIFKTLLLKRIVDAIINISATSWCRHIKCASLQFKLKSLMTALLKVRAFTIWVSHSLYFIYEIFCFQLFQQKLISFLSDQQGEVQLNPDRNNIFVGNSFMPNQVEKREHEKQRANVLHPPVSTINITLFIALAVVYHHNKTYH